MDGGREGNEEKKATAPLPWWANPAYVAAIAGLIAAVGPVTAFVNGRYQLELEAQNQANEIRIRYLDRAIDPLQTIEYRQRVLTFLTKTMSDDDPMRAWAQEQLQQSDSALELTREARGLERRFVDFRERRKAASQEEQTRIDAEIAGINTRIDSLYKTIEEIDPLVSTRPTNAEYIGARIRLGEREVTAVVHQEFPEGDPNVGDFDANYEITNGDCSYADEDAYTCAASIPRHLTLITVRGSGLLGSKMVADLSEYDIAGEEANSEVLTCVPKEGECSVDYMLKSPSQ